MTTHTNIASLLIDLEAELRRSGYWQAEAIAEEALASVEPFAIDTMSLSQWLQFVFIPRMHSLAAAQLPLPARCEVVPVAEEYFGGDGAAKRILAIIGELDLVISRS